MWNGQNDRTNGVGPTLPEELHGNAIAMPLFLTSRYDLCDATKGIEGPMVKGSISGVRYDVHSLKALNLEVHDLSQQRTLIFSSLQEFDILGHRLLRVTAERTCTS